MKNVVYLFGFLFFSLALSSCTDDEPTVVGKQNAEVYYDFLAYPNSVDVDVELINSGNMYIDGMQYEVELFGYNGFYIGSYIFDEFVGLGVGESIIIPHHFLEYAVRDVYVRVLDVW